VCHPLVAPGGTIVAAQQRRLLTVRAIVSAAMLTGLISPTHAITGVPQAYEDAQVS
jgi:hypothetical protein